MCAAPPASAPPARRHRHARSISPPTSHRGSPCPAARKRFQPAACLERLERDQHGPDVRGAQRRLPPHRSPDATRHARSMSPPTSNHASPRPAVCRSVQPAAFLGRLELDQHEPDVLGAQRRLPLHPLSDATPSFHALEPTPETTSRLPPSLFLAGQFSVKLQQVPLLCQLVAPYPSRPLLLRILGPPLPGLLRDRGPPAVHFPLAPTAVAPAAAFAATLKSPLAPTPLTAPTFAATAGNASLRQRHV